MERHLAWRAMSEQNLALIRSGFAAFEQGDVSRMLDLMADDLVTYRADPDGASYHGKEGFLAATADWTEGFSDSRARRRCPCGRRRC
jgi:ketosteroid isomerase-like protein